MKPLHSFTYIQSIIIFVKNTNFLSPPFLLLFTPTVCRFI